MVPDHRADHPGCRALFPWDRGCKRWTNDELLRRARTEAALMQNEDRGWMMSHMLQHRDHYRRRTGHCNSYIAAVEGWRERDFDSEVASAEVFGRHANLSEVEVAHEAALQWNLKRQQLALTVLFAYGENRNHRQKDGQAS